MKREKLLSFFLAFIFAFVSGLVWINQAQAVSLQYQVLQPNGQTSHADQYMDKPANVVIKDGKYYVSMTSTIPTWIGSHPVTYTSINNGEGQIVNNAHGASFKFSTTDLNKEIPVTMHLDVKVANINMDAMVYLKFLNVPALSSSNSGNSNSSNNNNGDQAAATGGDDSANNSDNGSDSATDPDTDTSDQPKSDDKTDEQKVTVKKPVKLKNNKEPKKKSKSSNNGDSVIYPEKDKKKKAAASHGPYIAIASGTVVIVAALAAGVYFWKRKS